MHVSVADVANELPIVRGLDSRIGIIDRKVSGIANGVPVLRDEVRAVFPAISADARENTAMLMAEMQANTTLIVMNQYAAILCKNESADWL